MPRPYYTCRQAIDIDPDDSLAHTNLGGALFELGDIDEAFAQCGGPSKWTRTVLRQTTTLDWRLQDMAS